MARGKSELRGLGGPEKAAILLLALGDEYAAKLFRMMEDDEIREISQVMASLGKVSSEMVEGLLVDFAEQISSTSTLVGTFETTEDVDVYSVTVPADSEVTAVIRLDGGVESAEICARRLQAGNGSDRHIRHVTGSEALSETHHPASPDQV